MKYYDDTNKADITGKPIGPEQPFTFACHHQLACFNRCCRNLNLFLYPYDVLRLKSNLGITSDQLIDQYVDIVMREGHYFPEVLLRMKDGGEQPCSFLSPEGCRVYADRPHTCRMFPIEQGAQYNADSDQTEPVYFFRPPDFCLGPHEDNQWIIDDYIRDQGADTYYPMTLAWAQLRRLFAQNPWGVEGPQGQKAKMAFMAAYNIDQFRDFIFNSSFFKRYHIPAPQKKKLKISDETLLKFGFEWIKFFVWGIPSRQIKLKK